MLVKKNNSSELHIMDKESYDDLTQGTVWNIPQEEYESETILVLKTSIKKFALRPKHTLFFNEKNVLGELEDVLSFADEEVSSEARKIVKKDLMKTLVDKIKGADIDYNKIKDDNIVIIQNPDEIYDINFLITARGRSNFAQPMYDSFKSAADKSSLNITYTVIEHSENPEHSKFCKKNKLNYIWVKSEPGELFNKCLAYNMGAFFGNKAKYILFHDIDCLVQSDFFLNLFDNISKKKARAIQCFTGRRVLYINEEFTPKVIGGEFPVDDLSLDMPEVDLPRLGGQVMIGAPGGSILVERDLFFEVGGYDAELFLANSPEDAFFWEKIDTLDKMHISDEPSIELYHMYHPPTWMHNPHMNDMQAIHNNFKVLSKEKKIEIMNLKAEMIKEFK